MADNKTGNISNIDGDAKAVADHSADLKSDAQAALKLHEFLRRYVPAGHDDKRDILNDRYRIELSTPLPEFDSKTARAYVATDVMEPSRLLIAHVCPPNS